MTHRRFAQMFAVIIGVSCWSVIATAQSLPVGPSAFAIGQVYSRNSMIPIGRDTLKLFCADAKFAISDSPADDVATQIHGRLSPFEVKYDGSLEARLTTGWNDVWLVYSIDGGTTYRRFDADAIIQPIKIPSPTIEQEGSTYWLKGGLRAMGAPAIGMLMLLIREANSSISKSNDAIANATKHTLAPSEYLQTSSYWVSIIESLDLELGDGEHEKDRVVERLAAAKARAAALQEVGASEQGNQFYDKYVQAVDEAARIANLVARVNDILKSAAERRAKLEERRNAFLAAYNEKLTESVRRNLKELVADTVPSTASSPPPTSKVTK